MLSIEDNLYLTQVDQGTHMGAFLRLFWIPVLLSSELPKPDCPPIRVSLLGEKLIAFRNSNGKVGLLSEKCPHRRASLFFGRNEEGGIRCAYHGWKFDTNGNCVDMPSEPSVSNFRQKIKQTAYVTEEKGGLVWAYLGQEASIPDLPSFPWIDLPANNVHITKRLERTNWIQGLEGGIDSAHSNFLHSSLAAFRQTPEWMEKAAKASDLRAKYHALDRSPVFTAEDTDYGVRVGARRDIGEGKFYWRFTHWMLPFYNLFKDGKKSPGLNSQGIAWIPIDRTSCWTIVITWNEHRELSPSDIAGADDFAGPVIPNSFEPLRNFNNDYQINREDQLYNTFTGIEGIQAQDMAVQESMGTIVDRNEEHLGTSDTAIIAMRRRLIKLSSDYSKGFKPPAINNGNVYRIRFAETLVNHDYELNAFERTKMCQP